MKVARPLSALAAIVLFTGVAWFAGRATLTPPNDETASAAELTYTVEQGRVGRVLEFTASTSYTRRLLAYSGSSGVVTTVHVQPGQVVQSGARLFAVDEVPVFVATGTVPAYRDMTYGDRGRDVAQLQRFLATGGYLTTGYPAPSEPVNPATPLAIFDGEFDASTRAAVQRWQEAVRSPTDGVVGRGELVFVPTLPARIQLGDGIKVGNQVSPGAESVYGLSDAPRFEVVLGEEQRDLVPLDGDVVVRDGQRRWRGTITRATERGAGDLVLTLGTSNGLPLCRRACDRVPAGQQSSYPVNIIAVPATRGPVVPAAALQSDESGQVFVTDPDGSRTRVTVLATDGGWSVVDGVSKGDVLCLTTAPGTAQP